MILDTMSKTSTLHDYARMGAAARLTEIQAEIAAIRDAFPGLVAAPRVDLADGPRRTLAVPPSTLPSPARKRRKLSAAARRAISEAQEEKVGGTESHYPLLDRVVIAP